MIDLPSQIQTAARWADRERTDVAKAVVTTLEWLYANEAKIRAKIEAPPDLPAAESKRVYTQRQTAFLDFAKGGWEHHFEVFDDTGALIGFKHVGQEKRGAEVETVYIPFGSQSFTSAKAFIAAYERGEWKPRVAPASTVAIAS